MSGWSFILTKLLLGKPSEDQHQHLFFISFINSCQTIFLSQRSRRIAVEYSRKKCSGYRAHFIGHPTDGAITMVYIIIVKIDFHLQKLHLLNIHFISYSQEKLARDKARIQQRRNSESGGEEEKSPRRFSLPVQSLASGEKNRKGNSGLYHEYHKES